MLHSVPKCAIIVAGGLGTRMGIETPKQFLILHGKPLLYYSLLAFFQYDSSIELIIVMPEAFHDMWKKMCTQYQITISHSLCNSGSTRFLSSKNGLAHSSSTPQTLVAIHDAARPFVDKDLIARGFELASLKKTAVATVDLKDSVRYIQEGISLEKDRSHFKIVQTPQIFEFEILKSAFEKNLDIHVSDDATVVEKNGNEIFIFQGDYKNIKITTKDDLLHLGN